MTTRLEELLKTCKTMREIFEMQNCLVDNMSEEEELELRARYAGLTVEEARRYQEALRTIKAIENKGIEKRIGQVHQAVLNIVCC